MTPPGPAGRLRDGVYPGHASNAYGGVDVQVTITHGRISGVRIVAGSTFYPLSYLDDLPTKVITAQSARVPVVTGATASWQDFTRAVQQALTTASRP
ncbi:MAG TPA: FMN-binding protein [Pseudonocardiaceae bacterium]